jgi:hypothetical protein
MLKWGDASPEERKKFIMASAVAAAIIVFGGYTSVNTLIFAIYGP